MQVNLLTKFANSKIGKSIYKPLVNPNNERFLNNTIPQVETVLSTACYVWSTSKRKEIDPDRRSLLQIQNVGSGAVGLLVSSWANRKVYDYGENVIKHLDKNIDPKSIRQISSGIRVGLPIICTGFIMRFLIPSLIATFSGKVMDKRRENRLNVKV